MRSRMIAGVVVASGLTLGLPGRAAEAFGYRVPVCRPSTTVVPSDPSFVIRASTARALAPHGLGDHDVVTTAGHSLPFEVVPLNEGWARLVVEAPAGAEFLVLDGTPCGRKRVWRASPAWTRPGGPPILDGGSLFYDEVMFGLGFAIEEAAPVRLDWALTRAELRSGRHATRIERGPYFYVETGPELGTVFVRATALLLDGSEGVPWDGWIHRDPATGVLSYGTGAAPAPAHAPAGFAPRTPWVVGEAPVLTFALHDETTFLATTLDGAVVPSRTFGCDHGVCVAVAASTGTAFLLEQLPRGHTAPWRFEVAPDPAAPRFVVTAIEASARDRVRLHVTGPRALEDGTAQVTWGEGYDTTDVGVASGTLELEVAWAARARWRFELVPISGALRGEPCEGWLHRDPATGTLTLDAGSPAERSPALESCLAPAPVHTRVPAAAASRVSQAAPRRAPAAVVDPVPASSAPRSWWLLGGLALAGLVIGRALTRAL